MNSARTSVADNTPPWLLRFFDWTSSKLDLQDPYPKPTPTAVGSLFPPSDNIKSAPPPSSAGQATTASASYAEDNGGLSTVAQQHGSPAVRPVQAAASFQPMIKEAKLPAIKEELAATSPFEKHHQNHCRRRKRVTRQAVPLPPPSRQQQQHGLSLLQKEANDHAALCAAHVKLAENCVSREHGVALKLDDAVNVLKEKRKLAVAQAGPLEAAAHIAACSLKVAQAEQSAAKAQCERYSRPGGVIRSWMAKWDIGPPVDMDAVTRRVEEATHIHIEATVKSQLAWDVVHRSVKELNATSVRFEETLGSLDRAVGTLLFLEKKADCAAKRAAATARAVEVNQKYWEGAYTSCVGGGRIDVLPGESRTVGTVQDGFICYEQVALASIEVALYG